MTPEDRAKIEAFDALLEAVNDCSDPSEPCGGVSVTIRFLGDTDRGPGRKTYEVVCEAAETGASSEAPTLQLALRALAYLDEGEGVLVGSDGRAVCMECRGSGCPECPESVPHAWPEHGICAPAPAGRNATTYEIAQRVMQQYDPENMGRKDLTVDGDTWRLELSTGGWSDNEEWIAEASTFDVRKQSLWLWWSRCWVSTRRGGHYVFEGGIDDEYSR